MCLAALFFRVVDDAPVVVGANREELYARGGEPPRLLDEPCHAVGGVDPLAGGTWLGVNEHGVLVAVTNRRKSVQPAQPRSRGLLARELLDCRTAALAAEQAVRALDGQPYAGCNFLCVDRASATVVQASDWLRVRPLPPGIHVLTNHDVNDASDSRLAHALWWLSNRSYASAEDIVTALQELCGQTGNGAPPICLHGDDRGTVSSTIIALRDTLDRGIYLHAQGAPDQTPYQDYSPLLRQLATSSRA